MNIVIDAREQELIKHIQFFLGNILKFKNIQVVVESLPIGDIIIKQNEEEKMYIERKSLNDLASSIKDGRYEEQSYRLNGLNIHNHNIVYLIEGDVNNINLFHKSAKNNFDKMTLYSAMFSLNYVKGFSVFRSFNIEESALYICQMTYKISKMTEENKKPFYTTHINNLSHNALSSSLCEENIVLGDRENHVLENNQAEDEYCNVVKKVKKENITPENIGEIILCQIPSVSSTTAISVMKTYKTIPNLIKNIEENEDCLKEITYTNAKNQIRKINKSAISNIVKFLSP